MTDPAVHDESTYPVDEYLIAWLAPIGAAGIRIDDDTALPFRYVNVIDGDDDCNLMTSSSLVSVHTMCDASGQDPAAFTLAAANEADRTHARIIYLARHPDTPITLADGRVATIDYLEVVQKPIWVDYDNDQILRKVGRYEIGQLFVAAAQ